MTIYDDPWAEEPNEESDELTVEGVLRLLDAQAALLIAVATGGPQIGTVNDAYKRRRRKLNRAVRALGIQVPFPYEDLWAWYGHWSANLGTYAERRRHIAGQAAPTRDSLERALDGIQVSDPGSNNGLSWAQLDARVEGVATELRSASSLDDLQDVGRRCREILIDAAKLLADPVLVPMGTDPPKAADAKAWLELYLAARARGRGHRELRAFIPAAWDLAQKVTHGATERVDAYAAAQATVLVVRTLQQLERR